MPHRSAAHLRASRLPRLVVALFCSALLFPALGDRSVAQSGVWSFQDIDTAIGAPELSTFNPQATLDRWGNIHAVWASRDPNSAGLQLFYRENASGTFSSPYLLTDTGTVYDSVYVDSTSFRFEVDRHGAVHALFLSNVFTPSGLDIGLFYQHDPTGGTQPDSPILLTTESGRYDIAVDSTGRVHVVWLQADSFGIGLHHWSTTDPPGVQSHIVSLPCGPDDCDFPDPVLEWGNGVLHAFVRNDSGSVWRLGLTSVGDLVQQSRLSLPQPTVRQDRPTGDLLQMRGAIDSSGLWHLILSDANGTAPENLLYVSDTGSSLRIERIAEADPIGFLGFDVDVDNHDRVGIAWTTSRDQFPDDRPRTGYVELRPDTAGVWQEASRVEDINVEAENPELQSRVVTSLSMADGTAVIALDTYPVRNLDGRHRAGIFVRREIGVQVEYILPDVAAPGMSLVVEAYAEPENTGAFGDDGLNPETQRLLHVNSSDSNRVVIGPSVTSWNGRLLSTMLFVRPDAVPGDIPLRLLRDNDTSNTFTFTIVEPQKLGPSGNGELSGGGALGSGGIYGVRSPRGVIVVDSLRLTDGTYKFATTDSDPQRPGNQGYLPATILATGSIVIDSTATLTLSAPNPGEVVFSGYGTAGPGGGGGGAGISAGGGAGFTAGGAPSDTVRNQGLAYGTGSGGFLSGFFVSGGSLNRAKGGAVRLGVPSGGGTGHPFGTSGRPGQTLSSLGIPVPYFEETGGHGGGTGGKILENDRSTGGGGGAFATIGEPGGPLADNGGDAVGSKFLVPIAGGGGGGGAWSDRGRAAGGGGGGALLLFAERSLHLFGRIEANGADGINDPTTTAGSGGGAGAGGGVLFGAQGGIILGSAAGTSVRGGKGADSEDPNGAAGGDGSPGRVRVDGRVDAFDSLAAIDQLGADYFGPTTNLTGAFQVRPGERISGSAQPYSTVRLYFRSHQRSWSYDAPVDVDVDSAGEWHYTVDEEWLSETPPLYVVALEQTDSPSSDAYRAVPEWIMSTAGGLVIGTPDIEVDKAEIDFGCVPFGECDTASIFISNTGESSDLFISRFELSGSADWFVLGELGQLRIPAGDTARVLIRFCPQDTGDINATLRVISNAYPDSVRSIRLSGCGIAGRLTSTESSMFIGELCPGDCVDTAVTIQNVGDAPMRVTGVASNSNDVSIKSVSTAFPFTLNVGESRLVDVRICIAGGSDSVSMVVRGRTPYPPHTITVAYANRGPDARFPAQLDIGTRDVGKDDTCRVASFVLRNNRTDTPLEVASIGPVGQPFALVQPASPVTILPGDSIEVVVRFCGEDPGRYEQFLPFTLAAGGCTLDTLVRLSADVDESQPELALNVTDTIDFGNVPVGRESAPRIARVVNSGDGIGRDLTYSTIPGSEASASGPVVPFDIPGSSNRDIFVTMTPASEGAREERLIVATASGSFRDTVVLIANGVEPGIVADPLFIDFGTVRVGSYAERDLDVFNLGSGLDTLLSIGFFDSIDFVATSPPITFPAAVRPIDDTVGTTIRFTAPRTGLFFDTVYVGIARGSDLMVVLRGEGALEHATASPELVRVSCESDSVGTVSIENDGTWPLRVFALELSGTDPGAFEIIDQPGPDTVAPGSTRSYRIRYRGSSTVQHANVRILHSGSGQTIVRLEGAACSPAEIEFTISVPELSGMVGSTVVIPVELSSTRPLDATVPITLQLTYNPQLLKPASDPATVGAVASVGVADETDPGELALELEIPQGATEGTLISLPMVVLLGPVYSTDLQLDRVTPDNDPVPAHLTPVLINGLFTAIDCDTLGTIDLGGNYVIKQSIPNPARDRVEIEFEIARNEQVDITLYDASGTEVGTVLSRALERGGHRIVLDVSALSTGLYYYEIRSGRFHSTRRLLIRQ